MPKDDFDFDDPFELNGMAFLTHEDTTNDMAETFIEEFLRMGYNHKQVLALFRNPHYLGPHLAMEKRGEPFIRDLISEVFARWGRNVAWADSTHSRHEEPAAAATAGNDDRLDGGVEAPKAHATCTDPMGAPVPKLNL
jgi:hypothetical protein